MMFMYLADNLILLYFLVYVKYCFRLILFIMDML